MIPVAEPSITEKEIQYVTDAVKSGWVSSTGFYVEQFEKRFAEYIGTSYALTASNGTAALHLALLALDIGPGHEVIVPDLTFIATANSVLYTGATPVFADIDPETWCIDPISVERKITPRTKAIIPVHLYGHPADMDEIANIASRHGLHIIEDAAEAHGAEYKNQKVGSIGDAGIFSFYGNKIITTGEGGIITTNSSAIYDKAKYLRDHGMCAHKRYWHTAVGFNYRLTNVQAALGLAQLERIDELLGRRRQVFGWYEALLENVKSVRLNPRKLWAQPVSWMVCALCDVPDAASRDHLMRQLKQQGIDTRPFFYPVSSQPIYGGACESPVASHISERGLNLPSGPSLSYDQVMVVCHALCEMLEPKPLVHKPS